MADTSKKVPTSHVIGFLLSVVMTLVAAWAAINSDLPVAVIISGILILALLQAGVQLFMFMHITEKGSGGGHVPWNMMFHGFALAAILVAGSLFTMSFGFQHGEHGDHGDMENMNHEEMNMDSGEHSGH
ncbi:cytochrome aa3 quinol oxidase subunit IV [Halobacillus sp. ACCC02827]|uniref:cytochrome aa3 quinol oxidase subunit IV n=1 Tax=Bacillaceae TaxID=186817 RepID=UPI0002A51873|nr:MULTISPECIES: cytochrome aa3 quinol oxidase subunit IV [Bacillaceae]ELK46030.1 cytochrome aa3 quinol oxidase subunit IV [Halobacillus sp. BAB-2008]QHT46255.1 cytochrome aa3 quinol oxidase subunit IV [Bacillus sp. SB49]WJE17075.1 cytochrome aa3 quinol oxidase subunit IV [Halobacillus sp. ACCC02827]